MNHVESLQVSQGFAYLEAVQEQRYRGHDVLLLHQVAPQLSGEVWEGAAQLFGKCFRRGPRKNSLHL